MGGFSALLGHAVGGFEQARQQDMERGFADEQNRRAQIGGFLQKIAGDETAHPFSRNAAIQEYIKLSQQPWNKPYKFDPNVVVAPPEQQTKASFTPPPQPGLQLGMTPIPAPPAGVSLAPQAGTFMSPAQKTQMLAQREGAVTREQMGAEAGPPVMQFGPNGEMTTTLPSKLPGQTFENTFNPMMLRGMAAMMHPVQYADPQTGQPLLGMQNKLTQEIYGQGGEVLPPGTVAFAPSLIGKTGTEVMSPSGAITRTTTKQLVPPKGAGAGAAKTAKPTASAPPAPPPSVLGVPPAGAEAVAPTGQAQASTASTAPTKAAKGGAAGAAPRSSQLPTQLPRSSEDWQKIHDPVTLDAIDWATQGRKPTGGPMAERQVRARMAQLGLAPAMPIPPAMQQKIQEGFVARNSAIDLIDDVMANKKVLNSLLSSGKIAVASDPDGNGVLSRAANLTDQEARVASDFQQLIEHANLLRGPLGATGFRGKEAWGALQAQRGKPMADPRMTMQIMTGMRSRLIGLNSADKLVLGGQGMGGAAADPYEGRTATGPGGHKIKYTGGKWIDTQTGAAIL